MARKRTKLNALSSIGMPGHCFASPWWMIHTRHILLFVRMPAVRLQKPFEAFVEEDKNLPRSVLELGAGINSPRTIRHLFQWLTYRCPQAMLTYCNLDYPKVPAPIEGKSIWFFIHGGAVRRNDEAVHICPQAWDRMPYPLDFARRG